jgi:tRNA A37 methylthiotransferase MiaB
LVDEVLDNDKIQGRNYAYKPVVMNLQGKESDPNKLVGHHLSVKVTKSSNYSLLGELIS